MSGFDELTNLYEKKVSPQALLFDLIEEVLKDPKIILEKKELTLKMPEFQNPQTESFSGLHCERVPNPKISKSTD